MSDRYYPVVYSPHAEGGCESLLRMALFGAVVGGSATAASSIRRVQRGELDSAEALAETGRAAVAAAAATALAGAVANAIADQGLLRLGVMFATGAAVLYGVERWREAENGGDAER